MPTGRSGTGRSGINAGIDVTEPSSQDGAQATVSGMPRSSRPDSGTPNSGT